MARSGKLQIGHSLESLVAPDQFTDALTPTTSAVRTHLLVNHNSPEPTMADLVDELSAASSLLNMALGRYLGVCSAIQNYYKQTGSFMGVPRALSDRVASEVSWLSSYDSSMQQAKSIMNQARNCSPSVVPIRSLAPELLARIFHLVVGTRPCNVDVGDNSGINTSLPKYPDFLSHVCSHWRQVAIGLPTLWTHIDVVNLHAITQGFVSRAEVHAARAGDLPLDVHVQVPTSHWPMDDERRYSSPLLDFLGWAPGQHRRIGSLELTIPSTAFDFDELVLERCIDNCLLGRFTQLIITDGGDHTPLFVKPAPDEDEDEYEDGPDLGQVWLRVSQQELEGTLLRLTILQLDGIYFPWSSPAYHELVELRLTGKESQRVPNITQLELRNMLSRSPRLRLLQFGLRLTRVPENTVTDSILPVQLNDLEVLNLLDLGYDALDAFLGLFSPGSKPLQVAHHHLSDHWLPLRKESIVKFFKHSNITKLHLRGWSGYPLVDEILDLLPHLQVLALDRFGSTETSITPFVPQKGHTPSTTFRLETLYVLDCSLHLDQLLQTIEKHPVKTIVFHKGSLSRDHNHISSTQLKQELSALYPETNYEKVSYGNPSPIKNWD